MHALPEIAGLKEALIVLGAAGLVIPLFHRIRISPVVGFLLVGVIVGPFGLGRFAGQIPLLGAVTMDDPRAIAPVAGFGVVLLLFMIGFELSFARLWVMRRLVLALGGAQLVVSAGLLAAAAHLAGASWTAAAVLGLAGAMSSTAIGLQTLAERRALGTRAGRASFSVLLFQDLAVLPVLVGVGLLLPAGAAHPGAWALAEGLGRGLGAIVAIVLLGRLALRPVLRSVARTRSPDLFMAACLFVVIGAALSAAAAGLSMALGALLGGLLLAGTEYRRAVEATIEPFKGLAVGVFLISVGMGLNLDLVAAHPGAVAGGLAALLAIKFAVVLASGRAVRLPRRSAAMAGLLLAPGGEFGLVILAQAAGQGLLGARLGGIAQAVTALGMALIPALAALGGRAARLAPAPVDAALLAPAGEAPRVILAGFGRMGRMVGRLLDRHGVAWLALEYDVETVVRARREQCPVYYGDASQVALLRGVGVGTAAALVVTMDAPAAVEAVVAAARRESPGLRVVARARDAAQAARLYRAGATNAVPETIEASLQLAEAVLTELGVPMGPVIVSIHETRAALQAELRAAAPQAPAAPPGRRRLRDLARPGGTGPRGIRRE